MANERRQRPNDETAHLWRPPLNKRNEEKSAATLSTPVRQLSDSVPFGRLFRARKLHSGHWCFFVLFSRGAVCALRGGRADARRRTGAGVEHPSDCSVGNRRPGKSAPRPGGALRRRHRRTIWRDAAHAARASRRRDASGRVLVRRRDARWRSRRTCVRRASKPRRT